MAGSNKIASNSRNAEASDSDSEQNSNGHCRCCHCGAPGGSDNPSSQSYQRMKKHLQQMLEEKRSSVTPERELSARVSELNLGGQHTMEEIDSLVNFIEGRHNEHGCLNPKKAAKKARKKARKLEEEEKSKREAAEATKAAKSSEQVPNGLVRIKHNPLTNSTVITPLYGPPTTNSNFYQQPASLQPLRSGPATQQVLTKPAPPAAASLKTQIPATPAVKQNPSSVVPPPAAASPSSPSPQMVTIRRVTTSLADPVVTVTLKGDSSESDRVLFTLVNGQVQQQQQAGVPSPSPSVPKPKPPPPKPVVSESELALKAEQRKAKKKQKKQEKKEKKKNAKNSNAKQQPVEEVPVVPSAPSPRFHLPQYQNHFQSENFSLENLRLPPGITLTRVQEPLPHEPNQRQFPLNLIQGPEVQNRGKQMNPSSPIIVSQPSSNSIGSLGGLTAPNVIVVDTRQIQEDQSKTQPQQPVRPAVRTRSIGVQTGYSDSEDEEMGTAAQSDALSRKQKKKLRKKERKANSRAQEAIANTREEKKVKLIPTNQTQASLATTNGLDPRNGESKTKKKKKKNKSNSKSDDKWEESIFAPKSDLDLERGDMDDDERELEAFKRFCFNSVPPERKEKVRVHLNVKDIFGKKPSLSANCK